MDKQAFKQRMQQLKQYREQNPGKTYLDFKRYADGGKTEDRTDHPVYKPIIPQVIEGKDTATGERFSNLTEDRKNEWRSTYGMDRYGKKISRGNLTEVYPEFDIISGIRGLVNTAKNVGTSAYKDLSVSSAFDKALNKSDKLDILSKYPELGQVGTPFQYSKYVDEIFPESQFKGVFYHGGKKGIDRFHAPKDKNFVLNKGVNSGTKDHGIYFTKDKSLADYYSKSYPKNDRATYKVKLNAQEPYETNDFVGLRARQLFNKDYVNPQSITDRVRYGKLKNNDSVLWGGEKGEAVVFNPDQIHILGNKDDLKGFSNYTGNSFEEGGEVRKDSINTPRQDMQDIPTTPLKLTNWSTPNPYKNSNVPIKSKPFKGFGFTSILDFIDLGADEYEIQKSPNPQQTRRYRDYQTRSAIGLEDQGLESLYSSTPHMEEGGEVPPTNKPKVPQEPIPYKGTLYKDRYGKKYTDDQVNDYYDNSTDEIDRFTGKPLVRGLRPALDLEDAANVTPVGDAISAYDAYSSARQGDWVGAGLSTLAMLPFVPMSVKEFRRKYKGVTPKVKTKHNLNSTTAPNTKVKNNTKPFNTTVNKDMTQYLIDRVTDRHTINNAMQVKASNQGYKIAERLMDDPEYLDRALQVKKKFGDDYTQVYADIIDAYNNNPNSYLPVVDVYNNPRSAVNGSMRNLGHGNYNYTINADMADLSANLTEHEWSHYADFKRNLDRPDAHGDSNMFYQMSKDLDNKKIDGRDSYYQMPTEQKAHMNQLREYMFQNGYIGKRGDAIESKMMKNVLDDIRNVPSMKGVFRASQQFKNINKYTKWFNSIPLLGVGAAAMYNNQEKSN